MQSPAIKALKWPLGVLVVLLGLLIWTCTIPAGGHPEGSGLAMDIYLTLFLPALSLLGLLVSILAWVRSPAYRGPALVFCLAYGAGIVFPCAVLMGLVRL